MKPWVLGFVAVIGASVMAWACGSTGGGNGFGAIDGSADVTLVEAGHLGQGEGGNGTCVPLTCKKLGYTCGLTGDGCGGMIDCGVCSAPETCGGGGQFSVCGGSGPCVSKTCAELNSNCGPEGDGCGNLIQCGSCSSPDICGGGGTPSKCGTNGAPHPDGGLDGGPCVPKTCMSQGLSCGPAGDGCGNVIQCGSCTMAQETCGGGGVNGQCGQPGGLCVPKTCAQQNVQCGPAADGCGNVTASCGSCMAPQICGGNGPGQCGTMTACQNLCLQQQTCPGGGTTSLSGYVVAGTLPEYIPTAPAGLGPDPIPNVVVYVPNSTPSVFTKGVECAACGADVTGDPLVETTTNAAGYFQLDNIPVPPAGGTIPLVIQLGRWRRIFGLGNNNNPGFGNIVACQNNVLSTTVRMPRTQSEGDIPFTAVSTGQIDPMECVLLKMGVDKSEFTNPGGGGRIEMYQGNGSFVGAGSPPETTLVPNQTNATTTIDQYDQVLFPCWGLDPIGDNENTKTATQQQNVVSYANAGGRIFATHLSYSWLYFSTDYPFNNTATWVGDPSPGGDPDLEYNVGTANIASSGTAPTDVQTFYAWMNGLAWNGSTAGKFPVAAERNNISAVGSSSELWINVADAGPAIATGGSPPYYPQTFPAVYTFATPYPTPTDPNPSQCGKVIYSDFHVSVINVVDGGTANNQDDETEVFPTECTTAPMSAQEKALEYLIWDLASCLPGPANPSCIPKTCADYGANCGSVPDGCGSSVACGSCSGCEVCGGGGTVNVCGGACCTPETCTEQNIECGPAGNGCGQEIQCGNCPNGLTCGGGGNNGKCGSIDAGPTCEPLTCQQQGFSCGPAGDGCGHEIQCGSCPMGQMCGSGGKPGVCAPECIPKTCAELGYDCGPTGDGCGKEIQCGTCNLPQTCGGGGKTSVCGGTGIK